jgi:hypothetical protein
VKENERIIMQLFDENGATITKRVGRRRRRKRETLFA